MYVQTVMNLFVVVVYLFLSWTDSSLLNDEDPDNRLSVEKTGPCSAFVKGYGEINLGPLKRTDGYASFYSAFKEIGYFGESTWNFSFNPCRPFNEPFNPHQEQESMFGDGCTFVTLCRYIKEEGKSYYYTYGVQNAESPTFTGEVDKHSGNPSIVMTYVGAKGMSEKRSRIYLRCNRSLYFPEEADFHIIMDDAKNGIEAELHHICACPGACSGSKLPPQNSSNEEIKVSTSKSKTARNEKTDNKKILVIVGVNFGVLLLAGCVGVTCYKKKSHLQLYYKLPGVHAPPSSQFAAALGSQDRMMENGMSTRPLVESNSSAYRDYEPDSVRTRKKMYIPVLENCLIKNDSLQLSQRLGGGIYSDTNVGDYMGLKVAVTRITLNIHENQISQETLNWMQEEVWVLSRQRHRYIVSMLGICIENRLPYIISEFVEGQSVKYYINNRSDSLTWPQRVKICMQAADGLAYLHSTKPPILHRDLRCANIFISNNDVIKVADFGLIKLIQPLRNICDQEQCCCQGQFSGCASSLRWTAPEIIKNPQALENDANSPHTIYSDVYSFGMVMWELAVCEDPFGDITEQEVMEIVKKGKRPDEFMKNGNHSDSTSVEMLPQYKVLMHTCWNGNPDNRPKCTQVATRLKETLSLARTYQKTISNNKKKLQASSSSEIKT